MSTFYLAASFPRQQEARQIAETICEATGWACVSSWFDQIIDFHKVSDEQKEQLAIRDLQDVSRADRFIMLTGDKKSMGGRHTEFGWALKEGKPIFLIGPREQVFHQLHAVRAFDTVEAFLEALTQEAIDGRGTELSPATPLTTPISGDSDEYGAKQHLADGLSDESR